MSSISAGTTSGTALVSTGDTSGNLELQSSGSTKLTVSSTGVTLASALPVGSGGTGATTLTSNNVILGNGGSAVQFVAPGSNGNVLTSNGTTWTSAAASGGAWNFITSVTANNSATVDVENAFNAYDMYALIYTNVYGDATYTGLRCQLKIGGSYISTTTYGYSSMEPGSLGSVATGQDYISIASLSTNSSYGSSGVLYIYNPSSTSIYKGLFGILNNARADGPVSIINGWNTSATSALTGVRFYVFNANMTRGTFRLYGIKNS